MVHRSATLDVQMELVLEVQIYVIVLQVEQLVHKVVRKLRLVHLGISRTMKFEFHQEVKSN
ncbi:hypothetical protein Hanom_Chr04g00319651 [Helianthus anomalus]